MVGSMADDNGLTEVARDFAEHASVEEFILLWLGHVRQVTYIDYDAPDADLGCVRTIKTAFGSPHKFSEETLVDAISDMHSRGRVKAFKYPVREKNATGPRGNPQKYRVVVTL